MSNLTKRLKQALSVALLGAVAFSLPNMADAKRIHDPKVETKVESRHNSESNKTVNLTENRSSEQVETKKYSNLSLQERIDAILKSRQREKELNGEDINNEESWDDFYNTGKVEVPTTLSVADSSIIGTPIATQRQCVKYLLMNNPNPNIGVSAEEIVSYYYEEGEREGIRPDVALCQAFKETGFFRYGGDVVPEQNNYCGLGTTGGGVRGLYFESPQIGVRAHIQHLLAYSSTRKPTLPLVDPRYSIVRQKYGSQTLGTWQDLNGRWAVPGNYYGQEILSMFRAILTL